MALRPILLILAALALSGCGTDTGDDLYSGLAKRAVEGSDDGPAQASLPSRAVLDQQPGSYLLGRIEATGGNALMLAGGQNGDVTTWMTSDGATISTQDGILVATRGMRGVDLMSADVPSPAQISRGTGQVVRSLYYIGENERMDRQDFVCELRNAGGETVTLLERNHATQHIIEACTGATGTFENHYWIEGSGVVRKSRQWIGPTVGSIELDLLKG